MIAGYEQDASGERIYINTGWGQGNWEIRDWYIPSGKAYLYYVEVTGQITGDSWCIADDLASYLDPIGLDPENSVGFTGGYPHNDYEVERVLAGRTCSLTKLEATTMYKVTYDEVVQCTTPSEKKRLDEAILDVMERVESREETPCWEDGDGPDCDDGRDGVHGL